MWTIFRREMAHYFTSPVSYLIGAAFYILMGLYFNNDLTVSITVRAADPASVPLFLSFVMVFFAPLLTMRLIAEENREGTVELLLTAPVSDTAIVIGKFLSAWVFYSLLLAGTLVYPLILVSLQIFPDLGIALSAYIGIWLYGGAALAVGVVFSAITDSQVMAAFLSMSFLLLMWLGDLAGNIAASFDLAELLRKLSLQGHYSTSFAVGLFRAEDVAYFAGMIVVALFITIRLLEMRRWR